MLEAEDIEKLEKRAAHAVNGYTADENITCYSYGRDVCALLNDRQEILIELGKWKMLAEERERRPNGFHETKAEPVEPLPLPKEEPRQKRSKTGASNG